MHTNDISDFKKILVYQDSSKEPGAALLRAIKLAKRNSAKLKVVDVVSEMPQFFRSLMSAPMSVLDDVGQARRAKLRDLVASVAEDDVEIKTDVLVGRPFVELIREVVDRKHDVLMKDARAEAADLFFGSLDVRLLRYCPCPLWLVKPHVPHKCERVVVAIDPEASESEQKLNEHITRLALSISRRDGGQLSVVSVWRKPTEVCDESLPDVEAREQLERHVEQAARNTLERTLREANADLPPHRIGFVDGRASEVITDVVEEVDADLLVMGTIARNGVSGLLLGNTAEKVLRLVRCSVLTIKPHGFVSPIEAEFSNDV